MSEVGGSHQTGDPAGTRHWARKRGTSESELVAFWNVETWTSERAGLGGCGWPEESRSRVDQRQGMRAHETVLRYLRIVGFVNLRLPLAGPFSPCSPITRMSREG